MAEKAINQNDELVSGKEPESLYDLAVFAFGDEEDANWFLNKEHSKLDGKTPLDAAKTKQGEKAAKQILHSLIHVCQYS